jgi:hypothetical protein
MPTMKVEDYAMKFLKYWVRYYGLPLAITSD